MLFIIISIWWRNFFNWLVFVYFATYRPSITLVCYLEIKSILLHDKLAPRMCAIPVMMWDIQHQNGQATMGVCEIFNPSLYVMVDLPNEGQWTSPQIPRARYPLLMDYCFLQSSKRIAKIEIARIFALNLCISRPILYLCHILISILLREIRYCYQTISGGPFFWALRDMWVLLI